MTTSNTALPNGSVLRVGDERVDERASALALPRRPFRTTGRRRRDAPPGTSSGQLREVAPGTAADIETRASGRPVELTENPRVDVDRVALVPVDPGAGEQRARVLVRLADQAFAIGARFRHRATCSQASREGGGVRTWPARRRRFVVACRTRSTSSSSARATTGSSPPACSRSAARASSCSSAGRRSVAPRSPNSRGAPTTRSTALSYVVSLMPPAVQHELELARHGYHVFPQHGYFAPHRDGRFLQCTPESIGQFSRRDVDAYPAWEAWLAGFADVLGPLLTTIPPRSARGGPPTSSTRPGSPGGSASSASPGVADVTKLFTSSIADLLDDWFESPQMQGLLSVSGVIGTWAGPRSAGTAYVMAHHKVGDVWATASSGTGASRVAAWAASRDALRRAAESFGATVRTDASVARIDVRDGRARGVVLESGEELRAEVVIAATHPKITFLDQIDARGAPRRLRRDDHAVEDAERDGQGQRRGRPAARVHRQAGLRPRGARRHDRARRDPRRHRRRVPGRGRRTRRDAPVRRRLHPVRLRRLARAGRSPHRVDVHAVGAARMGDEAEGGGARVVRRSRASRASTPSHPASPIRSCTGR